MPKRKPWVPTEEDALREVARGAEGQVLYITDVLHRHRVLLSPVTGTALLMMGAVIAVSFGWSEDALLRQVRGFYRAVQRSEQRRQVH